MRYYFRISKDICFKSFSLISALLTFGILALGLWLIVLKGFSAVSFDFISSSMSQGGLSGGILYQIIGTFILIFTVLLIVSPLSVGIALLRSFYLKNDKSRKIFTTFLYVINGIPSIIFGIFGFFLFVKFFGWGKSWLTGGILLSMMILPTVSLSLSEGISRIPKDYIESAKSLGLSSSAVIFSVVLPQSFSSFISGLLLGLARAAGETAPLLFTATIFSGADIPGGIKESPILSLPYHIFTLAQESYQPQALENAWGSVFVLILIVVFFSALALPFRLKSHEEANV